MPRQLVITGMHRSGTSLVASVLHAAGLAVGAGPSGPAVDQPRGHFEDPAFRELHDAIFAAAGTTCFTAADAPSPAVAPPFLERARSLVAARDRSPQWGFKDPRTCLFLDLWQPLLGDAGYLFLYRHPIDVALSLWRRDTDPELRTDPELAFRAWVRHNRCLLDFRARHPGRSVLAHGPALARDFTRLLELLRARLGLTLDRRNHTNLFDASALAPSCQPRAAWSELIPQALEVYAELEGLADLPAAGAPAQEQVGRSPIATAETLLFALVATHRRLRELVDHDPSSEVAALQSELDGLRRRRHDDDNRAALLTTILESRGFGLLDRWWRLRRRFSRLRRNQATALGRPAQPGTPPG